jgi:hypothetical protein
MDAIAIEVFFVETADYVQVADLRSVLSQMAVTETDLLVLDLLKVVMSEHQVDISGIDGRIVMDKAGRLVTPETCVADLQRVADDECPVSVADRRRCSCWAAAATRKTTSTS